VHILFIKITSTYSLLKDNRQSVVGVYTLR